MKAPRKQSAGSNQAARSPRFWLVMAGLCGLALLAYVNSFDSGFVLDNRGILLQDPRIRAATADNVGLIFQHTYWWPFGESGLYRPLTTLTYLFNYSILGDGESPAGYHWMNILLHAGNVVLVFALLRRLFGDSRTSAWGAALWAVHPVLTESVTNIVGRADLLAGLAVLGGLLLYLKSAEAVGSKRLVWLAGMTAVSTAGVFAKESAAILIGAVVLYELSWWKERRRGRALAAGCIALAVPLAIMAAARAGVFRSLPPVEFPFGDNPLVGAGFWTARLTALKVMAHYLGLLFWPAHLSCDYSYAQAPLSNGSAGDWLAWLTVAAAGIAIVWLHRRCRPLFFLCGLAILALLPTSNLLFPIGTIMAERFLYLPAIAVAALVAWTCQALAAKVRRPVLAPVALSLVAAACMGRTWARNADWRDNLSLMKAAVAASPDSHKSHSLLAAALFESDPGHSNIDAVIAEAEKGLAILDPVADWHNSAGPFRSAGGYYIAKADSLTTTDADGLPVLSPEGRRLSERGLVLLLRARSIQRATLEWQRSKVRPGEIEPQPDAVKVADTERAISVVGLRLGALAAGIEAAANAQQLEPARAESYRQLAGAYLAADQPEDGAIALAEGTLLTDDAGLRQDLIGLYRQGLDPRGCATFSGAYGPALNPSCETVTRHFCAAGHRAARLCERMKRDDLRQKLKAQMGQYRCE